MIVHGQTRAERELISALRIKTESGSTIIGKKSNEIFVSKPSATDGAKFSYFTYQSEETHKTQTTLKRGWASRYQKLGNISILPIER